MHPPERPKAERISRRIITALFSVTAQAPLAEHNLNSLGLPFAWDWLLHFHARPYDTYAFSEDHFLEL